MRTSLPFLFFDRKIPKTVLFHFNYVDHLFQAVFGTLWPIRRIFFGAENSKSPIEPLGSFKSRVSSHPYTLTKASFAKPNPRALTAIKSRSSVERRSQGGSLAFL